MRPSLLKSAMTESATFGTIGKIGVGVALSKSFFHGKVVVSKIFCGNSVSSGHRKSSRPSSLTSNSCP